MRIRPIEVPDIVIWAALRQQLWPDADLTDLAAKTREYVVDIAKSMFNVTCARESIPRKSANS